MAKYLSTRYKRLPPPILLTTRNKATELFLDNTLHSVEPLSHYSLTLLHSALVAEERLQPLAEALESPLSQAAYWEFAAIPLYRCVMLALVQKTLSAGVRNDSLSKTEGNMRDEIFPYDPSFSRKIARNIVARTRLVSKSSARSTMFRAVFIKNGASQDGNVLHNFDSCSARESCLLIKIHQHPPHRSAAALFGASGAGEIIYASVGPRIVSW